MVKKESLMATLMEMDESSAPLVVSHQGRSENAIRNTASLVGRRRKCRFSVHTDWDAGKSTITFAGAR